MKKFEFFQIGDECHYGLGSDVVPCRVVDVETRKVYTTNGTFTLRRDGEWRLQGCNFGMLRKGHQLYFCLEF